MPICRVGETKTIKGAKYTKKNARSLCGGVHSGRMTVYVHIRVCT